MSVKILHEILKERHRQNKKWGEQNHNLVEWVAILSEEIGEVSKEAVDYHFKNLLKENPDSMHGEIQREILLRYQAELIQAAAVIVQMIESLERNELENVIR